MKLIQVVINGKPYKVGKRIGKGGEGEIYTIQDNTNLALKIYTVQDKSGREQKISAMVSLDLASKSQLVSFPVSIARSVDGIFLGFVMRLVSGHKPLHELYSPGSRKIHFPQADYRFLVRVAANIARAVASVHQAGCVIGDINHSGMLVSPQAVAALIDADSFQISTKTNQFLCKVGVPEYTPPELQGENLSSILRTKNHDAFGLAVVIFQILFMGRHPFVGTVRSGEIPPLHENIKNFKYVYAGSRNVGMDQPPGTPLISDFSPAIAANFELAFSNNPSQLRPSAEQWIKSLADLEASLVKCDESSLHYMPRDASECPWCEMEKRLSTILFLPYIPNGGSNLEFSDPGAINFNLELIWQRIEAVSLPGNIEPRLKSISPSPSPESIAANSQKSTFNSLLFGIGAIVGLISFPQFFIIWLPLIYWGFSKDDDKQRYNSVRFLKVYEEADKRWFHELNNWKLRIGVQLFYDLKSDLINAKDTYKELLNKEPLLIQEYRNARREKQLISFLDTFDISSAKILGIGPAKQATLSSYGIDTAADIFFNKLLQVPGFSHANSKPLIQWRETLSKKFVYQSNENEFDRQEIIKIRNSIQSKLVSLRQKLNSGAVNLTAISTKIQSAITIADPMLELVNQQRTQAKVDLRLLGVPVPISAPPAIKQPISTQSYSVQPAVRPSSTSNTNTACPKCGSSMVKRLARRGRNAGNYFWGCSRYPSCKGTRNI